MNLLDHDNDSLYDLIKSLSANQDLDEILDHVREILISRLDFNIVLFLFYDTVSESLSAPLAFNKSMFVDKYYDPLERDSSWINEFTSEVGILSRNNVENPLFENIKSEMLVPIASGEKLLGAVYVARKSDRSFSTQQKRYVDIVSTFLAIPFEKLLLGTSKRHTLQPKEGELLRSVSVRENKEADTTCWAFDLMKSLAHSQLEPAVEHLALTLNEKIDFDYFSFYHLQPDRMQADFYELAHPDLTNKFPEQVTIQDTGRGLAWVQKRASDRPEIDERRLPYNLPAHTGIPVLFRDQYYGTLAIGRIKNVSFTSIENEWIKMTAFILGLLVAVSFTRAPAPDDTTTALAEMSQAILSCLRMENMLRESCRQLKKHFKADVCNIRSVEDDIELWFPEILRADLDQERAAEWKQMIIKDARPVLVKDADKFLNHPRQLAALASFAVLPVQKNERCVGGFILSQFEQLPDEHHYENQCLFIADVIKSAILNSQLYENSQKQIVQLQEFNRTLAHDLKAPLASIKSYFELLHQEKAQEFDTHTKYQERIQANLEVMDALIEDLLVYYRLDGRGEEFSSVSSGMVVKQVLDSLHGLVEKYQIEVVIQSDLPMIWAQETALRQIFRNLISNAIQACKNKDNARIEITSKRRLLDDEFLINDNGPGIEPSLEKELFKPFSKNFKGGTGLGLAIAKRAVQSQGGEIGFKSRPGLGSTFYFTIPRDKTDKIRL